MPSFKSCEYCDEEFVPRTNSQRFCPRPKTCRQSWHRENPNGQVGKVYGVYQRPTGGWSVVLHFDQLPGNVRRGESMQVIARD